MLSMQYYQISGEQLGVDSSSLVVTFDGEAYNLSSVSDDLGSFTDLARAANACGTSVDAIARDRIPDAKGVDINVGNALLPVTPTEVWAAGVTYQISEQAREAESGKPEVYLDVFDSERPELFLKATPSRTVGPNDPIGIRRDSTWDVPEPELAVVLHRGSVVGYTVGNDVSSRSIEGENPLYLPQAKVYDRCCSIGPCVATPDTVADPHNLEMTLAIERDDETVYRNSTSTSEMATTCETLVEYLQRHNKLPETTVLLTGTGLVPPESFTLSEGDRVSIEIENIGLLVNETIVV